jgi:hypothetical protein
VVGQADEVMVDGLARMSERRQIIRECGSREIMQEMDGIELMRAAGMEKESLDRSVINIESTHRSSEEIQSLRYIVYERLATDDRLAQGFVLV